MSIGHKIIEYISDANLVSPRCVQDEAHDIINVWSSQAPEQLEALLASEFAALKYEDVTYQEALSALKDCIRYMQDKGCSEEYPVMRNARKVINKACIAPPPKGEDPRS